MTCASGRRNERVIGGPMLQRITDPAAGSAHCGGCDPIECAPEHEGAARMRLSVKPASRPGK